MKIKSNYRMIQKALGFTWVDRVVIYGCFMVPIITCILGTIIMGLIEESSHTLSVSENVLSEFLRLVLKPRVYLYFLFSAIFSILFVWIGYGKFWKKRFDNALIKQDHYDTLKECVSKLTDSDRQRLPYSELLKELNQELLALASRVKGMPNIEEKTKSGVFKRFSELYCALRECGWNNTGMVFVELLREP